MVQWATNGPVPLLLPDSKWAPCLKVGSFYYGCFLKYTGTGTMFGAYPCPAPTIFKYEMNIYWPSVKNKLTNKEYSLHST